jgi:lipoprotein-anchoring transpeptidase ErfK/SrfK
MKYLWIAVTAAALTVGGDVGSQTRPVVDPRAAARTDTALRVLVSLHARRLWVVNGESDTVLAAPVAVGSGKTLRASGRTWTFNTPRGIHVVRSKEENPIWVRPDWSYVEIAQKYGFRRARIETGKPLALDDGRVLEIRDQVVGIRDMSGDFSPLPADEEIVIDRVLYVPPIETRNRRVPGQLGQYRLNLGDGIGLHGTPDSKSVGRAVTHGCMRLHDADLEWLFTNIPVGTRVYIF